VRELELLRSFVPGMSYQLIITPKDDYLHAVVTGANSRENVLRYLQDIRKECGVHGCYRVLIEERLEGPRLSIAEVFRIAAEGSARAQGRFKAIAYVDVNAEGDSMKFAETVAVNRNLPVMVFASVDDAERWLRQKPSRSE